MEDIAVFCSWADAQLNADHSSLRGLPTEVRSLIIRSTASQYLESLADAIRDAQYTDALFPLYKPLLPELLARWSSPTRTTDLKDIVTTISCLARVLPLATYLRPHVKCLLRIDLLRHRLLDLGSAPTEPQDDVDHSLLLAVFRLLSFDRRMLADIVTPVFFSSFLRHRSLSVRYLAVQCLCIIMHFADAFSETMVKTYVGNEAIWGEWEGRRIDYRLLKLWEERRWKSLDRALASIEKSWQSSPPSPSKARNLLAENFSPRIVDIGGVLHLPLEGQTPSSSASTFVLTATAKRNLRLLGQRLLDSRPILISGPASSGKTSLIHEAARLLNQTSSMITLHLNEQTDAKSLLGIHTSSADGRSFTWQPGVLTKAMQQGRWVLIEDIDRTPGEVMGVLRPILENGDLFLPSRNEKIRPKDGFRILATVEATRQTSSATNSRQSWLLNPRLWSTVEAANYPPEEVEALLYSRYPNASVFIPTILRVHRNLLSLYKDHHALKRVQTRLPSLKDLLNLLRRIVRRLGRHGGRSETDPLPEHAKLDIFKDAVDCYAGYLDNEEIHDVMAESIAAEMNISPQQMRYCLNEALPAFSEDKDVVQVGRSTLTKIALRRRQAKKAPFALTTSAGRTLDRIAACADCSEPCLLVGETGVGKTTLVQHIANLVGQTLTVINLSQQSEAGDLIGGLKPVTVRSLVLPVVEKFNTLFDDTFSAKRNEKFQIALAKAFARQNWSRLIILWNEAIQMAATSLNTAEHPHTNGSVHANKKRRLDTPRYEVLRTRWADFSESLKQIRAFVDHGGKTHTFAFVESRLVQAVREGGWVLFDEINLAPSDTLDHIVSLLHNGDEEKPSLLLTEAGNIETIIAHPNFRVFAAMNPATDAGKKDLPPALRSQFTEIYVPSGDSNLEDLTKVIQTYLGTLLDNDKRAALDLANSYLELKRLNEAHQLTDGAGETPHFSIRSLVRCLLYVSQHSAIHGLRRAMFEGFAMSFFTVLSRAAESLALPFLEKHLLSSVKNRKAFFSQQPKMPLTGEDYIAFKHHIVKRGPMPPDFQPHYIRTPSVERNLLNLARAASMRRFPILLQGPTSAGKTSMVEYLAKLSGNKFVRINNHEHTDLQEYLGSYMSDTDGKLVFREGVLVDALRLGHWVVLDELNLAPSDVLEALNRLLDDNRELLIPESQEIVRPHPNFMLFATQNPAGLYGGRKRLSRAFRNRFLEIHFDDIPEDELEIILRERAQIAPSFCTKIVAVYKKLSLLRQSSRLFEQRNSFATLRDLFRWASRPVDDWQQLAHHGFMLLAERVREPAERAVVKSILEETIKVVIDESVLYGASKIPDTVQHHGSIVWTPAMRRVFVLVAEALKNNEPVLLVGETGCGKTQICQVIAEATGTPLDIYNAHTNTETGDLIGSQRPIRNRSELVNNVQASWQALIRSRPDGIFIEDLGVDRIVEVFKTLDRSNYEPRLVEHLRSSIGAYEALFAWNDGSLVRAMKRGEYFLLDEISLAEDSVLERLNSVLEPSRTILLAEKGSVDNLVVAHPRFQFLATMNPGGDYGKRELSAALRNRLTEIWVPPLSEIADLLPIVQNRLGTRKSDLAKKMLEFAAWFRAEFHNAASKSIALRDLLAWADFINRAESLGVESAFVHGAFMVYIDSIGANPAGMTSTGTSDLKWSRQKCLNQLQDLASLDVSESYKTIPELSSTGERIHVGPFSLPRTENSSQPTTDLVFNAPTTAQNTMRIVRALQMARPILLEGSPGVGKTAIVTALAQACGKMFTRINLSDQTDLMDLFGADAPSDNEGVGKFSWQDGPLLKAMQSGGWVLLDEMNLASQSVLEGLNACLDHRREVYIAELDKSFLCHPDFTLFAAQNPHHQGGGRKGLPASFVNRFTVVYADSFQRVDLVRICESRFPDVNRDQLESVIDTATHLEQVVTGSSAFAHGGPWELNLRDVSRWLRLYKEQPTLPSSYHLRTIVTERFRTPVQRDLILKETESSYISITPESFYHNITESLLQIGNAVLPRDSVLQNTEAPNTTPSVWQLPASNSIITAVKQNWPVILAGPSGSGKTTLVRYLAAAAGVELVEFSMNSDVDTIDLVGGFDQYDVRRDVSEVQTKVREVLRERLAASLWNKADEAGHIQLLRLWRLFEGDEIDIPDLQAAISGLLSILPELRAQVEIISTIPDAADQENLRFVWNDGILVNAIEKGSWLLLENANLCNPSVLDRLNSLLEPGGSLAISEQHSGSAGTRIIEPHPNFRIFLTMDPRYGELSRAMRNRSLEIFMPEIQETSNASPVQYPIASALTRLRHLSETADQIQQAHSIEAAVDNLDLKDMKLISHADCPLPGAHTNDSLQKEIRERNLFEVESVYRTFGSVGISADNRFPQMTVLNEPLILLGAFSGNTFSSSSFTRLFTRYWYLTRRLAEIDSIMKDASTRAQTLAIKDQTILERSISIPKREAVGAAPNIAAFGKLVISLIAELVQREIKAMRNLDLADGVERMLCFTHKLILLCNTKTIDLASFQAYLQVGTDLVHLVGQNFPEIAAQFSNCLETLGAYKPGLKTGFGLQFMWPVFRPKTASTWPQLNCQLALEELIGKFDVACRSLPQARNSLSGLKLRLQNAYASIVDSGQPESLMLDLQEAVSRLEEQSTKGFFLQGKFENVITFVYEAVRLQKRIANEPDLENLAMFMPQSEGQSLAVGHENSVPNSLARLASLNADILVDDGSIGLELSGQLSSIQQQPLGTLGHAKEELQQLTRALATHTYSLGDFTSPLTEDLLSIIEGFMFSFRTLLTPEARECFPEGGTPDLFRLAAMPINDVFLKGRSDELLSEVYIRLIHPVLSRLQDRDKFGPQQLKTCLVRLSLAGLILMVPDRPMDPATYPKIVYHLHDRRQDELLSRIEGQKQFHRHLMGTDTALVIRILQQELLELGTVSQPPAVVRPGKEELFKLQEIFTRIVNGVLEYQGTQTLQGIRAGGAEWIEQWSSQQGMSNLRTIIERLESSHRAFDDFVKPILWFLKCLYLALKLEIGEKSRSTTPSALHELIVSTPLLTNNLATIQYSEPLHATSSVVKFHWLDYIGVRTALTGKEDRLLVEEFLGVLDSFYFEWKTRLTQDQADAATRSRYYTYRGDALQDEEDESREMSELFPRFEDEDQEVDMHQHDFDVRATAARLSMLHQKIYARRNPEEAMEAFILSTLESLPKLPVLAEALEFTGDKGTRTFNIYSDSDVQQSQKLLDLVHEIQSRFYIIQEKWPEHAIPAEVLSFCREILHLSFGDPVAKLLTKTEKLFEIVSQWQSIASREWSVSPLVEQLSSLIISWRRLELLSWSRLLDEEMRKHEEDAQAWYFIAYEAVIYNSRKLEAGDEGIVSYQRHLVETLQEFLKSATLGQYSSRLRLLDTLNKTMQALADDHVHLNPIAACVQNIIDHYRRYEGGVESVLHSGRVGLEKALSEQIKLASWKDTNVTALRESARRSHHKLFKIVRKYRDLLNQAVVCTAPEESGQSSSTSIVEDLSAPRYNDKLIVAALGRCRLLIDDWSIRPERLTQPLGAIRSMRHVYKSKDTEFQAQVELASFREDLLEASKQLKTQTPSTLTEDNTPFVRHLQERKRRLLADTLKAVAHMGVRRNLPTSELEKQSSCAAVLALAADSPMTQHTPIQSAANGALHQLLDVMPEVRAARTDHSDDLTDGEINRCVGLLEGLLFLTIRQRQASPQQAFEIRGLGSQLSMLRSVVFSPSGQIMQSTVSSHSIDFAQERLAWLTGILNIAHRILKFQAEYGGFDIKGCLDSLRSYAKQITDLRLSVLDLPEAPLGLAWKTSQALMEKSSEVLSQLKSLLVEWQVKEPRVEYLMRQIIPWTETVPQLTNGTQLPRSNFLLRELDQNLKDAVDQVFVAMQRLSSLPKEIPSSEEDQGWLSKSDRHIVEALSSLKMSTITSRLEMSVTQKLQYLAPEDFEAAKDLLLVAMPVLDQYYHICEHLHKRYVGLYLETSRMALQLARSFTVIAKLGFCRPSEPADGEEQTGKLESGTGLGEGEGAEDISKDVQDDEDLSELAREGQKEERDEEMEKTEDAVDMDHEDLEGEMGDTDERLSDQGDDKDQSGDEEQNDIDEETGTVDDLDPNAVDEKLWDDIKNESEKEREMKNDKAKGKKSEEQTAGDGNRDEGDEGDEMEEMGGSEEEMDEDGEDQDEGGERPEGQQMDQHVEEENALDLPEELQLAGEDEIEDDDISDDGMDELSDMDNPREEVEGGEFEETGETEQQEKQLDEGASEDDIDLEEEQAENGVAQDDEIMEDQPEAAEDDQRDDHNPREDDTVHELEETAGGESGAANEVQENVDAEQTVEGMNQTDKEPNPQQSQSGKASEDEEQGKTGTGAYERGAGRAESLEYQQNQSLKQLADVLDRWHQRREILPAAEEKDQTNEQGDIDMADVDFEHVQDEDEGDAQALGAAAADQAQNLDPSKAIEDEDAPIDEDTALPDVLEPEMQEDIAERFSRLKAQQRPAAARDAGAFVPDQQPQQREYDGQTDSGDTASDDLSPDIEQLELSGDQAQLAAHPTSSSNAAQLWQQCSATTHQFSLILTEQLRLILSPTTATKLRGDYRTGKRLNIRRIIPYIASNYKRDKIWMRRSVPSKRNYQIMIAVDDSKSMSESGADVLAFETLALLTKSLAMLEVGEICVVGFGDSPAITVAHPFDQPFSPAESGPQVFRAFSFEQRGTDVKSLLRQSIRLFRDARTQRQGGGGREEQWQLQLIVSDGHCSDHDGIARLVRQAHDEERVVIVFVIVDAGDESILDLKEAVFEPDPAAQSHAAGPSGSGKGTGPGAAEMRVRTKRYLDGFPFPYYLVVRDVRDLPGVLATALKGWFGSVVDVQG
ncbi:AAA domain-containing protein [Cladophialophora immunda]|nr:AAA domain-containing protein [Cladophialophora immunda]